jgi:eukaryotic-like serine/threonine-protein kinase
LESSDSKKSFKLEKNAIQLTRRGESYGSLSVAENNELYYSVVRTSTNIWALPGDVSAGSGFGHPEELTTDEANDTYASANSTKLVFASDRGSQRGIWLKDFATGSEKLLASSDTVYDSPKLSPDGSSVAYASYDHVRKSWTLKIVRTAKPRSTASYPGCGPPAAWSPDGRIILFGYDDPVPLKPYGAGTLDVSTGEKIIFQDPTVSIFPNSISPDSRWVAFHTRVAGQRKLWIAPFRRGAWTPQREWRSAIADPSRADMEGHLAPTGQILYFLSERDGHRCVWARSI